MERCIVLLPALLARVGDYRMLLDDWNEEDSDPDPEYVEGDEDE